MKKALALLVILMTVARAAYCSMPSLSMEAFTGWNFVESYHQNEFRVDMKPGYMAGMNVAYKPSRLFKTELEVAYRNNSYDKVKMPQHGYCKASGEIQHATAIINALIEIPIDLYDIIPYCGIGLGQKMQLDRFQFSPVRSTDGELEYFPEYKSTKYGMVMQGIVGFKSIIVDGYQAGMQYRYLDGHHMDVNHTFGFNVSKLF